MTNCARAEQFLLNRLAKNIRHCVVTIYLTLHYLTLHYITLHYITLLTFLHFGAFVRFFPHIQIFSRLYNLPPRQAFWSSRRPDSLAIICVVSSERKILQTAQIRKFEPKEPHHRTGKINLRLFSMYLFIFYVITRNSASRSVNPIHLLEKC